MNAFLKKYFFYILRWQLSTPLLTFLYILLAGFKQLEMVIIANFIGALFFFWIDKYIFTGELCEQWEVREKIVCVDCGKKARGYRLVKTKNYDRADDINPEFRCEECSIKKFNDVKKKNGF